ncbi:MAG: hypothetical protein EA381_01715 [Planctomycetaceae bacterium]|nr:MAG: hypothetical protein EA381_01715 [Planctomycetaceae bacterium]
MSPSSGNPKPRRDPTDSATAGPVARGIGGSGIICPRIHLSRHQRAAKTTLSSERIRQLKNAADFRGEVSCGRRRGD